ncbi:beta-amylase 2, chloroplastic-like isoform X2 [Dioscorea cayenensis subsp. rotundata]|uniref:Beta-amylase n=1 Tax=Dioscorea cayennensis subsp. rotundata TaxID=55577 RepID=A0AB40AJE5_DIOCR|nr:beta-amylase 2, chloroplastic-like isoform X2 [Dioscorea cayenensis subsp. rotundata]
MADLKCISDSDLDLFIMTNRSGRRREGYLSFAADELPILSGKTPLQAFEAFFASFHDSFSDLFGSIMSSRISGFQDVMMTGRRALVLIDPGEGY